jgi:putative ABC transport system permease protein
VKNAETVDLPGPQVYVPFAQHPGLEMTVVLRSARDPVALAGIVRETVASIDPAEPVDSVLTMEDLIHRVTGPFEITATFVTFFGLVTLLLAAVGVYGVISYTFARRTKEIGIRMALGANRLDVARLVARQIRTFVVAGLVPGILMAWVLGHALESMLVGVTPGDWRVYAAMAALLSMVALLAALVPARRVTAIDPVAALRHE